MSLKKLINIGLAGVMALSVLLAISGRIIGNQVKAKCIEAQKEYSGTCNQSLINLLEDNSKSYKQRSSAIWALGQIGKPESLPVLKRFEGDTTVDQYELKKALKLVSGGINITAVFWRFNY